MEFLVLKFIKNYCSDQGEHSLPSGMFEQFSHFWKGQKSVPDDAGNGIVFTAVTEPRSVSHSNQVLVEIFLALTPSFHLDSAPSSFHLFGPLKEYMGEQIFEHEQHIHKHVHHFL
jgi:hypothetical protein